MENNIASIYCDESCHLEHDGHSSMALSAVWCLASDTKNLHQEIRKIKIKHGLPVNHEFKWKKLSNSKLEFYKEIVEFFFTQPSLHARVVLAKGKSDLCHGEYDQTHDDWYYKMYYFLLANVLQNQQPVNIYIDPKDTRHSTKIRKLRSVLSNKFGSSAVNRIQVVRSFETELMQIADLFAGASCYNERGLNSSKAKVEIVKFIKQLSGSDLNSASSVTNKKFNFFPWSPS